jgi:hypothetical protein
MPYRPSLTTIEHADFVLGAAYNFREEIIFAKCVHESIHRLLHDTVVSHDGSVINGEIDRPGGRCIPNEGGLVMIGSRSHGGERQDDKEAG